MKPPEPASEPVFRCIYCLKDYPASLLTKEHIVPEALGGALWLGNAACGPCNSTSTARLDAYLATKFPPTTLPRADLGLQSYSGEQPRTELIATDPVIGEYRLEVGKGLTISLPPQVKKIDQSLFSIGHTEVDVLRKLKKATKQEPRADAKGLVARPTVAKFAEQLDWKSAERSAAKIMYCYALLEIGDSFLDEADALTLRTYIADGSGIQAESFMGDGELKSMGKLHVPSDHHLLVLDEVENVGLVCLFGGVWFRYRFNVPRGRVVAIHATKYALSEAYSMVNKVWYPRISIDWPWTRGAGFQGTKFSV